MKRLNPLYIVLLFLTLVVVSFVLVIKEKDIYMQKIKDMNTLEVKAKEYKNLSQFWKNQKFIEKTIDEILKNSMLKNEKITKTSTKESIKIKIESSNPQVLDNFLNRFLNKQLIMKKIEIDKNFINLEIGVK